MRRRNLDTMGSHESGHNERGAWTPFVGVALAALTAGSLLLFSFIAQRTSLEGFSTRGVTAVSPSLAAPRSITLPEPSDESDDAVAVPSSQATTTDTALSTLSPTLDASADLAPTAATPALDAADELEVGDDAGTPAPLTAAGNGDDDRDSDDRDADDDDTFSVSFADDESEIFYRDGEGRAAAQEWQAPDEGDADRSARGRSKGNAHRGKADNGKQRGKTSARRSGGHDCWAGGRPANDDRGASARKGSGRGCRAHPNQRRGGSDDRDARGRAHRPEKRERPAGSGRPTHSSPPAPRAPAHRASPAKGKGSPPAHSNAGGKAAHGRGRGHGRN